MSKKKVKWPKTITIGSASFFRVKDGTPFYWFHSSTKPGVIGSTDRIYLKTTSTESTESTENKTWICMISGIQGSGTTPEEACSESIETLIEQENTRHNLRITKLKEEQELIAKCSSVLFGKDLS